MRHSTLFVYVQLISFLSMCALKMANCIASQITLQSREKNYLNRFNDHALDQSVQDSLFECVRERIHT